MRRIVFRTRPIGAAFAALVIVLGLVAEANAQSRRGRTSIPQPPANIDSSPMVDGLNKALKALSATDRDYDGHREKAINHIHAAIRDLQVPNAKGQSTAAGDKASADHSSTAKASAKAPTTPQADSDASLSKAQEALFAVHHKLTDKASTRGRIHADAEVRIAIDELVLAKKSTAAAAAPASGSAPASVAAPATASRPGK